MAHTKEEKKTDIQETVQPASEVSCEMIKEQPTAPSQALIKSLQVPVLINTEEAVWPDDKSVFYLVASNGTFKCRNHKFFTSCVKTDDFPTSLEHQREYLQLRYPKIPKAMFEKIVGFFSRIYDKYESEAIVLIYWDTQKECYYLSIPKQYITYSESYAGGFMGFGKKKKSVTYGLSVDYDVPTPQPHLLLVADVHSHADLGAFASSTDEHDEKHFSGIHVVVGKITDEPPDINIEAVVDGVRFRVRRELVLEGYDKRDEDIPQEWMSQMKTVKVKKVAYTTKHNPSAGYGHDFGEDDDECGKCGGYGSANGYGNFGGNAGSDYRRTGGFAGRGTYYGSNYQSGSYRSSNYTGYRYREKLEAEEG